MPFAVHQACFLIPLGFTVHHTSGCFRFLVLFVLVFSWLTALPVLHPSSPSLPCQGSGQVQEDGKCSKPEAGAGERVAGAA